MRQLMQRRRGSRTATPTTGDGAYRRRWLRLPTSGAALAVSVVALVVAMAGSAYAGVTLANNSVGTKQLKNGAVTNAKIAGGAVGNGKLANGAVGPAKLKSGLVVPNATNAINATTAVNATALAKVTYIQSQPIASPAGGGTVNTPSDTAGAVACPTGTQAIGGGFFTSAAAQEISESEPTFGGGATKPATGWNGFVDNFGNTAQTFSVWAICTPVTADASTQVPVGPVPAPPGR
jgi:hypothetical protein